MNNKSNPKSTIRTVLNIILVTIMVVVIAAIMALASGCGGGGLNGFGSVLGGQPGDSATATYGAQQLDIQLTARADQP